VVVRLFSGKRPVEMKCAVTEGHPSPRVTIARKDLVERTAWPVSKERSNCPTLLTTCGPCVNVVPNYSTPYSLVLNPPSSGILHHVRPRTPQP
jgi:hypothetical protein